MHSTNEEEQCEHLNRIVINMRNKHLENRQVHNDRTKIVQSPEIKRTNIENNRKQFQQQQQKTFKSEPFSEQFQQNAPSHLQS